MTGSNARRSEAQSARASMSRRSVLAAGGAALAVVLGLSGCAQEDALAKQAKAGDNKNYVAGDGSVTEFAAADRKSPTDIHGPLFNGTTVTAADFQGKVTVLNFSSQPISGSVRSKHLARGGEVVDMFTDESLGEVDDLHSFAVSLEPHQGLSLLILPDHDGIEDLDAVVGALPS